MALVVAPSTPSSAMNATNQSPSSSSSGRNSTDSLLDSKELLLSSAVNRSSTSRDDEEDLGMKKKRPLASLELSISTSSDSSDNGNTTSSTTSPPTKKARTHKRRVQFSTELTETRTFSVDYQPEDLWWTNEESKLHMERQTNLLQFYANNCPEMADSVLLVWVHCAEEAMADGNYCITMQQRADLSLTVAQSPIRGFERELAAELIGEQRMKTIGGILELQALCQQNGVPLEEKQDALAAASQAFSTTANLFAVSLAKGDAKVSKQYCNTGL